jgi:hypothetical protein
MQRHWGSVCPDGKVMCCLCFDRFDIDDLSVDDEGQIQDVCKTCNMREGMIRDRVADGLG